MPTYSELTDQVSGAMRAWTSDQDQLGSLAADMPLTGDAAFQLVIDGDLTGVGLYEVDEELVQVTKFDSNVGTVPVWGRGQQGTTTQAHITGARVCRSPLLPRARIKATINEQIRSLYPSLFGVKSDESNRVQVNTTTYAMPADCVDIIDIKYFLPTGQGYWDSVSLWRLDRNADKSLWPTGVMLDIGECMFPGQPIKIVYRVIPSVLVNDSDDFETVTGLPTSVADIVALLAEAKLVTAAGMARLAPTAVDQSQRTQLVGGSDAINQSKYLFALAQERIAQERDRLYQLYPMKMKETWL